MDRLSHLVETRGCFTRAEARESGYDDRAVERAVRSGRWRRLRRGAFTSSERWTAADPVTRHRILARAVLLSLGRRVALSHVSAVVEHGLSTYDLDLSRVHVTRLDGATGRREKDVVHHVGLPRPDELQQVDGMLVMPPGRAVLETASIVATEPALVVADSALHLGLTTVEELGRLHARMEHWPGMQTAQIALRLADGRSESVGESRSRFLFWTRHLPAPELQFEVRQAGRLIGVSDFAWPEEGLLGEFDGKVKYGRLLGEDEQPGDAVFREKQREDRLREVTGFSMVRITWADLARPAEVEARIRRLMRRVA